MLKKAICALLIGAFAVSLCSCSSKTVASKGGKTATEERTEPTTLYNMVVDDYVYSEKKVSKLYSGDFYITGETNLEKDHYPSRMPQLDMDTKDASEINDDIHKKYMKIFENLEKADDSNLLPRTDYKVYLNDNILSIIIETRSIDTPNSGFNVYNIDVETGQKVDKAKLISLSNANKQAVEKQLKDIIGKRFESLKNVQGQESIADEAKRKSLSGGNIDDAVYYFNEDRKLCAAYRYYWIAGAENYGAIAELEAVKTRG